MMFNDSLIIPELHEDERFCLHQTLTTTYTLDPRNGASEYRVVCRGCGKTIEIPRETIQAGGFKGVVKLAFGKRLTD